MVSGTGAQATPASPVSSSPLGDVRSLVLVVLPGELIGDSAQTLGRLTQLGWVWFSSNGTAGTDGEAASRK